MINTKNVFKKLLGLSLSAIIAVTSLGGTAAFASNGRLSDKSINDIVAYRTESDISLFADTVINSVSKVDDMLKIQSYENINTGAINEYSQPVTRNFALNKSGDVLGALSFKIKADESNTNDQSLLFSFRNANDDNSKEATVFIVGQNGYLGSENNPSWTYTPGAIAKPYTKGQFYTIGIVFNSNYTYDIYVDGEHIGTALVSDEDQKTMLDTMMNIKFKLTVHNGSFKTPKQAVFYMKDVLWQVGGGALVAETETGEYTSGSSATVKFSAPIMNKDEVSKVKLFESATGAEQSAAASFDGDNVKIDLPNNLKSGREYRIELPEFKDCFGNTLTNDSVYFNVAASAGDQTVTDFFETFDSMGTGTKARPNGWNRSARGDTNEGYSEKVDNSGNSVMRFGHDGTSASGNPWRFVTMWCDLGTTFTSGTLTMSYDIAPSVADPGNWQSDTLYDSSAFGFFALSKTEAAGNPGDFVKKGAFLSGQLGSKLGGAKTTVSAANENKADTDNKWATGLELTESNVNEWHSVTMVLDLDNGVYKYYLDGELKNTSENLFNDVDSISDYSKIKSVGIRGIGLASGEYAKKSEQLIDNIKVSHSTGKALGNSTQLLNENFNGYTETNNITTAEAYLPSGWSHANLWGNQVATVLKPYNGDSSRGTALEMGLRIAEKESYAYDDTERWNNPELYRALDKKYTSGVLTLEYDVNPATLIDKNDTRLDKIKGKWYDADTAITSFNMTLYSDIYSGNQIAQNSNDNQIKAANAKRIFGIQNKNLSVYKDNTASTSDPKGIYGSSYTKAAVEGQWYRIRHIIDIDNDVIETYVGSSDENLSFAGLTKLSYFGLEGGIGGIGFGMNSYSYLAKTYLDNITLSYQPIVSSKGISAVRYSDYRGIAYGSASETTTLADTIAISFTDTPDLSNADISLYETSNPTKIIAYTGALSETADNVYIMSLHEFLTANTEYTLKVDGVTCGGETIEAYTHKITAEKNGELIIEPMKISVNGSVKSDGETYATETLKSGDTVEASVIIINTTGTKHEWAFSSGVYKNKMLDKFDYRMISLDGISADGKFAKAVCIFNIDAETVKDLTKIRAYLWNGMSAMKPQSASCDLICGAAK